MVDGLIRMNNFRLDKKKVGVKYSIRECFEIRMKKLSLAVMFPDEQSGSLCSWDARNTDRKRLLALGWFFFFFCFFYTVTEAQLLTFRANHS